MKSNPSPTALDVRRRTAIAACRQRQTPGASPAQRHILRSPSTGPTAGWPGSAGERAAAEYIVSQLAADGAKPCPDVPTSDCVRIHAGTRDGGSNSPSADARMTIGRMSKPCSFSTTGSAEGSVVFAGYGCGRRAGLRVRQLCDAGCEGQDRPRPPVLPPRMLIKRRKASWPDTVTSDTRRWSARQRGAKGILLWSLARIRRTLRTIA